MNFRAGFFCILFCGSVCAFAQDMIPSAVTPNNNSGALPYSTQVGTATEYVELSTGNLIINIPFISLPGRKMSFDFGIRYDASFWLTDLRGGIFTFNPEQRNWLTPTTLGWTTNQPYLTYTNGIVLCETDQDIGAGTSPFANFGGGFNNGYTYTDAGGSKHTSLVNHQWSGSCPLGTWDIFNFNSPDTSESGWWHQIASSSDVIGTFLSSSGGSFTGNVISVANQNESGGSYLAGMYTEADPRGNHQVLAPGSADSIGRVPVTQTTNGNQIQYEIKDSTGDAQPYTINLTSAASITTAFNLNGIHEYQGSRELVSSVVLPNNQRYSFTYDNGGPLQFAEVTHLALPAGATVDYEWGPGNVDCFTGGSFGRSVTRRTVTNGRLQSVWDFQYGCVNAIPTVTVTNPADANGVRSQVIYQYDAFQKITSVEYRTAAGGNLLRRFDLQYGGNALPNAGDTLPQLKSVQTTITVPGGSLVSRREFDYDTLAFMYDTQDCSSSQSAPVECQNAFQSEGTTHQAAPTPQPVSLSNVTAIREYDWGSGAPGPLLWQTVRRYAYQDNSAYSVATNTTGGITPPRIYKNIIDRVSVEDIYDGSTVCSGNGYQDENGVFAPPPTCQAAKLAETRVTYDNGNPGSYGYYGEPTAIAKLLNTSGQTNPTTHYGYDSYGNLTGIVDAKGNLTTVSYTDSWFGAGCHPPQNGSAYPTSVTNALQQTTRWTYYPCTGLKQASQDANDLAAGRAGSTFAYDIMNRQTDVFSPDGGHTQTTYNDQNQTVESKVYLTGSSFIDKLNVLDGLGRVVQTQLLSDPAGTDFTDTTYDALGRVDSISNPYRSAPSDGITTFAYDALDRKTVQTQPDGSLVQWCYNGVNTGQSIFVCSPNASTKTSESWVDYSDELNRHAQRVSDALGRLVAVMEPVSNIPTLETDYSYDALGNLLSVNQKGTPSETPRTRSFTYDSLSGLLTASNPETGIICYGTWSGGSPGSGSCHNGYDANGNLVAKTDARGITTIYSYDALNRLTQKSYNDGVTSTDFYGYDNSSIGFVPASGSSSPRLTATLSNTIGRLAFASSTSSGSLYAYSYDSLGRLKNQWLSTPSYNTGNSPVFQMSAVYDLAGNITSLTYPDGRVVNQMWDGGGHLSQVADGNSYSYLTSSTSYLPNGAPGVLWYGNGVGNGFVLNNRQRIEEMGITRVGSHAPGGYQGNNNLSVKEYCYGPSTSSLSSTIPGCPSLGVADNGSIWQVMDSLNGGRTQNFSYDSLNRITFFARSDGSMQQSYAYDSFGNLNQTSPGTLTNNLGFNANNQISSGGYGYDAAGNIIGIFNGVSTIPYSYDAESKLVSTNSGSATYTYDANGDRVRKDTSPNWTEYVRFNGKTLAEKHSDGTWSDYIFADGRRIARADNYDVRIHMSGTNCSGCSSTNTFAGTTSLGGAVSGTVIQSGDLLTWRQYQAGVAAGGVEVSFTDNSGTSGVLVAADGQKADADTRTGNWYLRVADLSAYQGLTVGGLNLYNYQGGAAGNWDIWLADISLMHPDGTVVPVYSRSLGSLSQFTPGAAESNVSVITEKVADTNPLTTVTHYSGDQIGSTVVLTDYAGWPVTSDTYYPFGQEPSPRADNNHYKFTGKERDAESGLDYFGARYYSSSMGRWMSPDWSAKEDPVPYAKLDNPQSLNLYGYVLNNPLSQTDDDGHEIIYAPGLKNEQLVRDTVTAILANPNTGGYLSGYTGTGPGSPNLTIMTDDLGAPTVETLPNGQTLTTQVQGDTKPDISTSTSTSTFDGVTSPPVTTTTMTGATMKIDTRTSTGDTPGVIIHESVHAGEALANPAKFQKDARIEQSTIKNHDSRPQEQRANGVRDANVKAIKQQIKQIEKDRKKDQQ